MIVLGVAAASLQDVLSQTLNSVVPLDRIAGKAATDNAIDIVSVEHTPLDEEGRSLVVPGAPDPALTERRIYDLEPGGSTAGIRAPVSAGSTAWQVVLEGRAQQQVRITDIVPVIEEGACSAPLKGTLVQFFPGGDAGVIPLNVAIDDPEPTLRHLSGKNEGEPYFTGPNARHITLDRAETEGLLLRAEASTGYCRWRYRIEYLVSGEKGTTTLSGPEGRPFALTALRADAADYPTVLLEPLGCGRFHRLTGAEYAEALGGEPPATGPMPDGVCEALEGAGGS
ncbi:hypothetical protein [Murinocardiopsis flavida]|uniref:hypothetical protein n=1 Tax=Murinocardiopsis flavida TaxID=645275 RepID=UPI000D0C9A15|nr:hypothetical protein [Murinocardiopsis flavida]